MRLSVLARTGALVAAASALALLPLDLLAALPEACVWKRTFGFECWGCGMTRALSSLARGEWSEAIAFNWRVVVVAPLLLIIGAKWVSRR